MNTPYLNIECKHCKHNICIEREFQNAQNFWDRHGERITYIFECGAYMNSFVNRVEKPEKCRKDK